MGPNFTYPEGDFFWKLTNINWSNYCSPSYYTSQFLGRESRDIIAWDISLHSFNFNKTDQCYLCRSVDSHHANIVWTWTDHTPLLLHLQYSSLKVYRFRASNPLYLESLQSLSIRILIFTLTPFDTWDGYYNKLNLSLECNIFCCVYLVFNWSCYCQKILNKSREFQKKDKRRGGDAHIREEGSFAYRRRDQTFYKLCAKMF